MGVHHAWGRTLKDVFQRYQALRGQRPALPERLRLPGPLGRGRGREGARPELEARDRGVRPRRVRRALPRARRRVRGGDHAAVQAARHVDGLGQRLLHLLATRTSSTSGGSSRRCTAAAGSSRATARRSGAPAAGRRSRSTSRRARVTTRSSTTRRSTCAFPLKEREGESLVVWTTTPWTLPANVAAAVRPEAEYGLRDGGWRLAETGGEYEHVVRGEELVGLEYAGPFDELEPQAGGRPPRDPVGRGRARRGQRDRPHRARRRHRGLRALEGARPAGARADRRERPLLPAVRPVRRDVDRGGRGARDRGAPERGLLVEAGRITHRYPICWRCRTPLVFRVVDDWFIGVDEVREQLREENRKVEWTPPQYGKRMDDWLRNMGDWNISRKRYFGLPLPFYPCPCGHLNVIGSRAELEERAVGGLEQLQELHRPWIDEVPIRCESCGGRGAGGSPRSATRGSTPGSCRSRRSAGRARATCRTATRPARPRA